RASCPVSMGLTLIRPSRSTELLPAAVLVFLAAAAGAGIVAADFWAGANRLGFFRGRRRRRFADDVAGFALRAAAGAGGSRATAKGAGGLVQGLLRDVAQKILEGHHGRGAAKDVVADLGLHADHQFVENFVGLGLVFDKRVALAVAAQADAVAQAVHFVEMFLPQLVNRAQNRVALDGREFFGVLEADFDVVSVADLVGNEIADGELRRAEAVENRAGDRLFLAGLGGFGNFRFGHAEREIQINPVGQLTDFPLARVKFSGGKFLHFQDDDLLDDVHEPVADVFALNDFVAEAVNDFALLVHHVVIFERAFANLEIVLL